MRRRTILLALVSLTAACGDGDPTGPRRPPSPIGNAQVLNARMEIRQLAADVEQHHAFRGEWPDGWADLRRAAIDPWGNEYALEIVDGRPRVSSAGPDGEHGTPDDVTARE